MQIIECTTCAGSGILADNKGWEYTCSDCFGDGKIDPNHEPRSTKAQSGNEDNQLKN